MSLEIPPDNDRMCLIGSDKSTRGVLLFDKWRRVEELVPLVHGSAGRHLPRIATAEEFRDLAGLPKWSEPNKKTGEVRKIRYRLGSDFGNDLLDALGHLARQSGVVVDRNLRPGLGAAKLPDGRVVFNFGDAYLHAGSLHPMTGEMCRYLDPGDGDALSKTAIDLEAPLAREHIGDLLHELSEWSFDGEDGHLTWLGWWGAALLSGCLDWRPHYSLFGEGKTGKTWLFEFVAKRLLGDLVLTSDNFTPASLTIKAGSHSLPFYIDEANATKTEQMEGLLDFMRTASNGGLRDRADGNADFKRVRTTIMRCAVYRTMNTTNDPNDIPNKRRIIYEQMRTSRIADFNDRKAVDVNALTRIIDRSLRTHWAVHVDLFHRRCCEITSDYERMRQDVQGCEALETYELDSAVPVAVAVEIALAWQRREMVDWEGVRVRGRAIKWTEEDTLRMVSREGLRIRRQVEGNATPKWQEAAEAIAYSHLGRVNNRDYTIAETVDRVRHNLGFAQSGGEYEVPLPDPVDKLAEVGVSVRGNGDVVIRAALAALHQRIRQKWAFGNGLRDALLQCEGARDVLAGGRGGRFRGLCIPAARWDECVPGAGDEEGGDGGEAPAAGPRPAPQPAGDADADLSFDADDLSDF